jgi:aryl-alcohol dehydrogenase-like predicted oxidoreductase
VTRARLALGTAQLGMAYGVANPGGRPPTARIDRILRTALDLGVDYIDTAPAYGDAEALVGRFLSAANRRERVHVCTKLPPLRGGLSAAGVQHEVAVAVERSRAALGIDVIDDFLVHAPQDLRENGPALVDALLEQRHTGRTAHIGASIYDADDATMVLSCPGLSTTQYPFSVFERSVVASGVARRLRAQGHRTVARSAIVQGLLALDPDRGEAAVPGSRSWLDQFGELCAARGVPPVVAALAYASHQGGADYLVVGVEAPEQLVEAARALEHPLPADLIRELDERFADVPADIRDPRRWRRAI